MIDDRDVTPRSDRDHDRDLSAPWGIKSMFFYQASDNCKTAFSSLNSSGRECNLIADVVWPVL